MMMMMSSSTATSCVIPHRKPQTLPNYTMRIIYKSKLVRRRRRICICSSLVTTEMSQLQEEEEFEKSKPTAGEMSRTIMELSSIGSYSGHQSESESECPSVAVRFAVEPQHGTPILSLSSPFFHHTILNPPSPPPSSTTNNLSSLNVQLDQCGVRTTQCTIQGSLHTPPHHQIQFFQSLWEKKFGEKVEAQFIHILDVQRVLHINNFMDDAVWVSSSDYQNSNPDPLRDAAHRLVHEINTHNMEDLLRFCNVYVHSHLQVSQAKMVWVDRLGLDIHLYTPQNDVFEVRIPFPRQVTNEKGARSSFNGMAQLAWEVEKNYHPLEFQKVKHLNKIASKVY